MNLFYRACSCSLAALAVSYWISSALCLAADIDPVLKGRWPQHDFPDPAALAVSGHHLYLAAGSAGLLVFDVSKPERPEQIATFDQSLSASDIAILGDYALVANAGRWGGEKTINSGLQVIDITNPRQPHSIVTYPTTGPAGSVATLGSLVLLTDGGVESNGTITGAGLEVLDLADPRQPKRMSRLDTRGPVTLAGVSGSIAGLDERSWNPNTASQERNLVLVDLANPASPRIRSRIPFEGVARLANGYAYVWTAFSLDVFDLAQPASQPAAGSVAFESWPRAMLVSGNRLYLGELFQGVVIMDLTDPARPRRVGSSPARALGNHGPGVSAMAVLDKHLFMATGRFIIEWVHTGFALEVVDVSDPANPQRESVFSLSCNAVGVAASDGLLYVANRFFGLQILDASDKSHLLRLADLPTEQPPLGIAVDGTTACIGVWDGLILADASDVLNPRLVGRYSLGTNTWSGRVATSPGRAFLSYSTDATTEILEVVDISKPSEPKRLRRYSVSEWPFRLPATNQFSFVRDPVNGWQVYETSASASPQLIGEYNAIAAANHALIDGDVAYTSWGVVEISNPARLSRLDINFYPGENSTIADGIAWIVDANSITGYEVSQPGAWRQAASVQLPPATFPGGARVPASIHAIALRGTDAFLAAGYAGVRVIDLGQPSKLRRLGSLNSAATYRRGFAIQGSHAFVASGAAGLRVIDISKPDSLSVIGTAGTNAFVVAVGGQWAYVVGGNQLQVIDIVNPAQPVLRTVLPLNTTPIDLALQGNHLYALKLGEWTSGGVKGGGLLVFDVGDPLAPREAGFLETRGNPESVVLDDEHAFVLDYGAWNGPNAIAGGLDIISLATPAQPRWIARLQLPGPGLALAVDGNRAYVAELGTWDGSAWHGSITAVDLSDPTHPQTLSRASMNQPGTALEVSGSIVYLGGPDWIRGLEVYDFSDPTRPKPVGALIGGSGRMFHLQGTNLFAIDTDVDLKVIDISTPAMPRWFGAVSAGGSVTRMLLRGDSAFGVGPSGLQVFDMADPARPRRLAGYVTRTSARALALSGELAVVAEQGISSGVLEKGGRLVVFDVHDRNRPVLIGSADLTGSAHELALSGTLAAVAAGENGVHFLDLSDPRLPKILSTLRTPGYAISIALSGNHAFVAAAGSGLLVLDVATPSAPRVVRSLDQFVSAQIAVVEGQMAYVVDSKGLQVFDIADPSNPRWLTVVPSVSENSYYSISTAGPYVCLADGREVVLYDFSTPQAPVRIAGHSSFFPFWAAFEGGRLAVGAEGSIQTLLADPFIKSLAPRDGGLEVAWESWGRARLQHATRIVAPDWQDAALPSSSGVTRLPRTSPAGFLRVVQP